MKTLKNIMLFIGVVLVCCMFFAINYMVIKQAVQPKPNFAIYQIKSDYKLDSGRVMKYWVYEDTFNVNKFRLAIYDSVKPITDLATMRYTTTSYNKVNYLTFLLLPKPIAVIDLNTAYHSKAADGTKLSLVQVVYKDNNPEYIVNDISVVVKPNKHINVSSVPTLYDDELIYVDN